MLSRNTRSSHPRYKRYKCVYHQQSSMCIYVDWYKWLLCVFSRTSSCSCIISDQKDRTMPLRKSSPLSSFHIFALSGVAVEVAQWCFSLAKCNWGRRAHSLDLLGLLSICQDTHTQRNPSSPLSACPLCPIIPSIFSPDPSISLTLSLSFSVSVSLSLHITSFSIFSLKPVVGVSF